MYLPQAFPKIHNRECWSNPENEDGHDRLSRVELWMTVVGPIETSYIPNDISRALCSVN